MIDGCVPKNVRNKIKREKITGKLPIFFVFFKKNSSIFAESCYTIICCRGMAQLVARCVRDAEAVSSSLTTPTIYFQKSPGEKSLGLFACMKFNLTDFSCDIACTII